MNACESSQGKPKQAKVEKSASWPVHEPIDVDEVWRRLPQDLVMKIALEFQPTRVTFQSQEDVLPIKTTRKMARNLCRLATADRQTFRCVRGLLHWARWAVELAQLHSSRPAEIPVDFLLSDPKTTLYGNVEKFAPPEYKERRLDSLLQGALVVFGNPPTDRDCESFLSVQLQVSPDYDPKPFATDPSKRKHC